MSTGIPRKAEQIAVAVLVEMGKFYDFFNIFCANCEAIIGFAGGKSKENSISNSDSCYVTYRVKRQSYRVNGVPVEVQRAKKWRGQASARDGLEGFTTSPNFPVFQGLPLSLRVKEKEERLSLLPEFRFHRHLAELNLRINELLEFFWVLVVDVKACARVHIGAFLVLHRL